MASNTRSETAVCILSDIHWGKKTKSFDQETLKSRLNYAGQQIMDVYKASPQRYDKLIVVLLGDMIDGADIYPSQTHGQEDTDPLSQSEECAKTIADWIRKQQIVWGKIEVECVGGNHGRKSHSANPKANYDILTYRTLDKLLRNNHIPVRYQDWRGDPFLRIMKIRGHRFLLYHGHAINFVNNTPFNGIWQRIMRWSLASFPGKVDVVFTGHFHHFAMDSMNSVRLFMNGTPVSDDDYALHGLGYDGGNSTWMLGVSNKRAVAWCKEITYV